MNVDSASAILTGGSILWTRFLQKSQGGNVRWLDRTLLLPTTDRSGTLTARMAPRVFEEVAKGKNPDGKYWMEFDDSGQKFNLVERVEERVPNSRQWLLKKFVGYTEPELPPLLHSRETLLAYLNERDLIFVPGQVIEAARLRDPAFYTDMKDRNMAALVKAATPSTLLFLIAFHREITWRRYPDHHLAHILADRAVNEFIDSFFSREFEDARNLSIKLRGGLQWLVVRVARLGDRCAPCVLPDSFEHLYPLPFLMEKSEEASDACACLYAAGERWYERIGHPLPDRYSEGATNISWEDLTAMSPSATCIRAALRVLDESISRAHEHIAGEYEKSLLFKATGKTNIAINKPRSTCRAVMHHRSKGGAA